MGNFKSYLELYKENSISLRQLCFYANKYSNEIIEMTAFLNIYQDISILERLYYIINDLSEPVKCKYCNNKASWTGRINDGYREICSSKECRKKQLSDMHTGNTKISENRDAEFIQQQANIIEVNDKVIKKIFKYDKYIDLLTNEIIIAYLKNRYDDSDSLLETVQRIKLGIEKKPKCPTCGKPVKWVGKQSKMFTTYCSDKCSANNLLTTNKKKATQLEHWGTENCYDSEKYKQYLKETLGVEYHFQRADVKEKTRQTMIERYGTTNIHEVPEIVEKIKNSNRKKYGYDYLFQVPEIRQKAYDVLLKNQKAGTSKMEQQVYEYFLELGYKPERFVISEKYHNGHAIADFYLVDFDLYIEYQRSQYHHGRAFFGLSDDMEELKKLQEKDNEFRDKQIFDNQYRKMIDTWTRTDVFKRRNAYQNKVNLIEIYSCKSADDLKTQIDRYMAAKFNIYASDELKALAIKYPDYFLLYGDNPSIRRYLIQDAMKRLNKDESDLSFSDIMESFENNKELLIH